MSDEEGSGYRQLRWYKHFEGIDVEIGQLATICQIPLLDPGVIERVLHNDTLACGSYNKRAFDKLRQLLMMHYSVRNKAVVALGETETLKLMDQIVARLSKRFGDKLGGPVQT